MKSRSATISTQPRVIAISDLSCHGKCSLTVALPLLSAFGVEACPLPTAILSTHTGGFTGFTRLDMTEEMQKIIAHWSSLRLRCDVIYTGYFYNAKQVDLTLEFIREFRGENTAVVVDPVMGDNGSLYYGFETGFNRKMQQLCGQADIVTPNMTEAFYLANLPYRRHQTREDVELCLQHLLDLGAKRVVITGVLLEEGQIGSVCADSTDGNRFEVFYPRIDAKLYGCGDVYSSVLSGAVAIGRPFEESVRLAASFTNRCVQATAEDLEHHWYGLKFEPCLAEGILPHTTA